MKTQVITYQITLLEPALVTALDGDPNSAVAYPYLPGSVLRGALIASYLADKGTSADQLLDDSDAARMFFGGSVCYLNGYPWDGRFRSLPTPRSWQQDKREASAKDMSVSDFILRTDDPDDETPWVSVEQPFTVLDLAERRAALMKPIRQVAVHTQRDPVYGRPRSNEGQIYRYDALAAGQVFSAAIVINADANPQAAGDSKLLLHLLGMETAIGGSRTGGYGRVKFTGARLVDNSDRWREIGRHNIDVRYDGMLIITLLSDALLRDDHGQYIATPPVIASHLKTKLDCDITLGNAYVRGRIVGGFNRTWGLPLPQAGVAQMGSVLALQAPGCKVDKLRELEQSGIGERRIEGFGRVAVNWYQSSELVTHDQAVYRSMETGRTFTSTAGRKLAELMVNRLWRAALDDAVMAKANQLGSLVKQPRKSQLARLRIAVENAMRQPPDIGRGALDRYLKSLGDRQVTRRQFEHDRVQGRSLLEWLRTRAHDETAIWTDLDAGVPPSLGDVKAGLTPALAYEYNLRLIDAVLARAAKEKEA